MIGWLWWRADLVLRSWLQLEVVRRTWYAYCDLVRKPFLCDVRVLPYELATLHGHVVVTSPLRRDRSTLV